MSIHIIDVVDRHHEIFAVDWDDIIIGYDGLDGEIFCVDIGLQLEDLLMELINITDFR